MLFSYYSYKQQHQIFIQHASQQIAIFDQQKQALKVPQPQTTPQPTPPPTQPLPSSEQSHILPIECGDSVSNNQNNLNGNSSNFIGNNRNDCRPPPPLMSQNITMPRSGLNPSYISSQQQQRINYPGDNSFQVRNNKMFKLT